MGGFRHEPVIAVRRAADGFCGRRREGLTQRGGSEAQEGEGVQRGLHVELFVGMSGRAWM